MKKSIPILMYHAIEESSSAITVSARLFSWQMSWLQAQKCQVLTLSEIAHLIAKGDGFPERSVVLTFDDGFLSQYTEAFPILRHYGFPATIYLVSGYMGSMNNWDGQPPWVPRRPLIDWEKAREMQASGIEFGVHTVNHLRLNQLVREKIKEEIQESKIVIEKELSCKVKHIAYPYGEYNQVARELASTQFITACSTKTGLVTAQSDRWALERVDIHYLKHPVIFKLIFLDVFRTYVKLRRIGHDWFSPLLSKQYS